MKNITYYLLTLAALLQCGHGQSAKKSASVEYSYINQEEIIKQALAQNLDLKLEKITSEIAEKKVELEEGKFGAVLSASYKYEKIDRPQNNREFVSTGGGLDVRTSPRIFSEENQHADLKITKKLKTGQTLQVGTEMSILKNSLNNLVSPRGSSIYHPEYETFTGLTFIQPLVQGIGLEANRHLIEAQLSQKDAAQILYKVKSLATAAETLRRYNALYFSNQRYSAKQRALNEVKEQHNVYKSLYERRKITATDMLESETFLFKVEEDLMREKNFLKEKELLLHDIAGSSTSHVRLIPTTPVYSDSTNILSKEQYIKSAEKNRLDTLYFQKLLESAEHSARDAKEKTKPVANLVLQGGYNGLAGDYGDSMREAFSNQGAEISVGLEIQASLTKSTEETEYEIAQKVVSANKEKVLRSQSQSRIEVVTYLSKLNELISEKKLFVKRKQVLNEMLQAQEEMMKRGEGNTVDMIKFEKQKINLLTQELMLEEELANAFINLQLASGSLKLQ